MNTPPHPQSFHNRTLTSKGISSKNELKLSKIKKQENHSISIKNIKKYKISNNLEPKNSDKSINYNHSHIKKEIKENQINSLSTKEIVFKNPINNLINDYSQSKSKRKSMGVIKPKSQNFLKKYNPKREDENYIVSISNGSSLNVLENNIKNAINSMKMKIEKTNKIRKNQTNSPKNRKKVIDSNQIAKKLLQKKQKKTGLYFRKTIKDIQIHTKIFDRINIKKGRRNSFDYSGYSKKILFKAIKNKINKRFKNKINVTDSDNFSESDKEYINEGFSFSPESKFVFVFDLLLIIADLYIFIFMPLNISKSKDIRENDSFTKEISYYFVDLIFLSDFILSFLRGYYNYEMTIIRNNKSIIINYLKKYFFFDLLEAIPIYSIIKIIITKSKEVYYGQSNIKLNILTIFLFIKPFKILKIMRRRQNKAIKEFYNYLSQSYYLEQSFNFIISFFIFFLFVHLFICLHIYLAYQSYPNWLTYTNTVNESFLTKYIASFYFMITTITTVGYGDIVCVSHIERIYHIFLLVIGTLVYTFLVSLIGNYLGDISHEQIKLGKDLIILESIRVSYPTLPFKLYSKIKRHLLDISNKRKKTGISILLNEVPDAIKKNLLIKIYSNVINRFNIFKNVNNSNFIYHILTSFIPIQAKKEEIIILEGELIENIVFVKDGRLTMEVSIDLNDPYNSIKQYMKNNFIGISRKEELKNYNYMKRHNSVMQISTNNYNDIKTKIDSFLDDRRKSLINNSKIDNTGISLDLGRIDFSRNIIRENYLSIKIFDIRKNEHFGHIHLYLKQPSPYTLRAKSRIVELFFLRKNDAIITSKTFPNIYRRILNKSFHNLVSMKERTFKMLKRYYNTYFVNGKRKSIALDIDTVVENNADSFSKYFKTGEAIIKNSTRVSKNKILQTQTDKEKKKENKKSSSKKEFDSFDTDPYHSSNLKNSNSGGYNKDKEESIKKDTNNNNNNQINNFLNIKSNKEIGISKDSDMFTFNDNDNNCDILSNKIELGSCITNNTKLKSSHQLQTDKNYFKNNDVEMKNGFCNSRLSCDNKYGHELSSNQSIQSFKGTEIINIDDSHNKIVTLENMNENFSKKIKKKLRKRKKIQKIRQLLKLQRFKIDKNLVEFYLKRNSLERKNSKSINNYNNSISSSNNKVLSEILNSSSSSEQNKSLLNKNNHRAYETELKIMTVESFEIKLSYNNINLLSKGQMINNIKYKNFIEYLVKKYLYTIPTEDIINRILSILSKRENNAKEKLISDDEKEAIKVKVIGSEKKLPLIRRTNNLTKKDFYYTEKSTENLENSISEKKSSKKLFKNSSKYLEKEFKNFEKLKFDDSKFKKKEDIINKKDKESNIFGGLIGKSLYKSKNSKELNKVQNNNNIKNNNFEDFLNKLDELNDDNYSKKGNLSLFLDKNNDISATNMINIKNNNEIKTNICLIY